MKNDVRKKLEQRISENLDILRQSGLATDERKRVMEETEALCRALKDLGGVSSEAFENRIWKHVEQGVDWALRIVGLILPLAVYTNCYNSGLEFEQTGTFTSKLLLDSLKRFSLKF